MNSDQEGIHLSGPIGDRGFISSVPAFAADEHHRQPSAEHGT